MVEEGRPSFDAANASVADVIVVDADADSLSGRLFWLVWSVHSP
jgi:hypothetical protein